jgi:predicted nucleic acid-binding protein
MNILFDSNVLLDVLLKRDPWVKESARLWQAVENGDLNGYIVASILTDLFYIVRRASSIEVAHESIGLCLQTFEIVVLDRGILEYAYKLEGNDFEDNIQIACAEIGGLDGIVTRDPKGYTHTNLQIWSPVQILKELGLEAQT